MWIAGIFAFFTIGLGHLYSGDIKKGVFLYLGQGVLSIIAVFIIITIPKPSFLILGLSILLIYSLYNIVDAMITARRNSASYQLKRYNKLPVYILVFALSNLLINPLFGSLVKKHIVASYKLPTGSMIPTILPGDQILANKYIYKFSKPITGDVVVFTTPHKKAIYIKRIIGVGGDEIEIKDKKLFVNNILQKEIYVIHGDKRVYTANLSPRDNFGPYAIPENSVFLLGDNRDNSEDSRFWGTVDIKNVHGKVQNLYWSWDKRAMKVRWGRVFQGILF